jgi:hypothetical protein
VETIDVILTQDLNPIYYASKEYFTKMIHLKKPTQDVLIQFIKFTYYNDQSSLEKVISKINKYQSLLNNIQPRKWKITPIIVITIGAKASIHISSIKILHIDVIAIQHAMSILLHKRRLENNQPLPNTKATHKYKEGKKTITHQKWAVMKTTV